MSSTYVAGSAGGLLSMNFSFAVFSLMKLYLILTPEFSPVTDAFQLSAELRLHQIQVSRCSSRQLAFFFHGDVVAIKADAAVVAEQTCLNQATLSKFPRQSRIRSDRVVIKSSSHSSVHPVTRPQHKIYFPLRLEANSSWIRPAKFTSLTMYAHRPHALQYSISFVHLQLRWTKWTPYRRFIHLRQ